MQNNKKSKKNNSESLRKILDNISVKDLSPKDEKYLRSLSKRLDQSSEEIVYKKEVFKDEIKKEDEPLKPKVAIYPKEEKKVIEFTEIKEREPEIEEVPVITPIPAKETEYEDEDLFEVEKVEVSGPKFVEFKPRETEEFKKEEEVEEKKALAEEELNEWEAVEKQSETEKLTDLEPYEEEYKEKIEDITEEKTVTIPEPVEDKEKEDKYNYCSQCGNKLEYDANFCANCGSKIRTDEEESKIDETELVEEIEPEVVFIPVEEVEEKEEKIKTEETPIELQEIKEEEIPEEPSIDKESKVEVFKEIKSIDDKTAILLYDNGYTTVDALTIASIKDLTKIKGIKRNTAKRIKKELEQKSEWEPVDIKESITEEVIDKKDEEILEIKPTITEKHVEKKITEEQIELKEENIEKEKKIEAFKDMESIDDNKAILLYDNGYTTVDALTIASIKDLTKIKGIKRNTAKRIKKELEQKQEWESLEIEEEIIKEPTEDVKFKEEHIKDETKKIDKKILEQDSLELKEEVFEEEVEDIPPIDTNESNVFKDINSIDEKIAKLLKENGINSIYDLRNTTIKQLTKIRGIKRKIAKQIKKEVEEFNADRYPKEIESKEKFKRGEENPLIREEDEDLDKDAWESFDDDKISESRRRDIKGFRHGDYTLYAKEIKTKSGKKRIVRFFSKADPEEGEPIELPEGYKVEKNEKTGVPYLKKKK